MERRQFTREFKLEAVRLIKDRGVSYVQASEDLGVHTSQLRDCVKKFADEGVVSLLVVGRDISFAVAANLRTLKNYRGVAGPTGSECGC
jgi:predicted DNA-binding protein (UPF0251 family)